ncbi:MAG: hypothetical protein GX585_05055, partial [Clostridiales bacterium]|nr:hypothetical protein [Clostridiales bacterium]
MEFSYTRTRRTRRPPRGRRKKERSSLSHPEKRRLGQLLACLILFAVVFLGKGVFPSGMAGWSERALNVIRTSTDFRSAFAQIGAAVTRREPVMDVLGDLWVEVFGLGGAQLKQPTDLERAPTCRRQLERLRAHTPVRETICQGLGCTGTGQAVDETAPTAAGGQSESQAEQLARVAAQMASREGTQGTGTAVQAKTLLANRVWAVPPDEELPDRCASQKAGLGLETTVTPVMGVLSSGYGYR